MNPTQDQDLTRRVIELAEKIHTRVGPGLFGEAYETCLAIELTAAGLPFEQGRVVPIIYKGHELD